MTRVRFIPGAPLLPRSRRGLAGLLLVPALLLATLLAAACSGGTPAATGTPGATVDVSGGDAAAGRQLFIQQCAACHIVTSIPQARGRVGPDLSTYATQPQIAGLVPNTPENLARFLKNPSAVKPGTAMPNLGLSDQQVANLVAFMQGLR